MDQRLRSPAARAAPAGGAGRRLRDGQVHPRAGASVRAGDRRRAVGPHARDSAGAVPASRCAVSGRLRRGHASAVRQRRLRSHVLVLAPRPGQAPGQHGSWPGCSGPPGGCYCARISATTYPHQGGGWSTSPAGSRWTPRCFSRCTRSSRHSRRQAGTLPASARSPSRPPAPAVTCSNGCACAPIRPSLTSLPASWRPVSAAWSRPSPQIPAHPRLQILLTLERR